MKLKHKKATIIIAYIYAFFLIATGIMTLVAWQQGIDLTKDASESTKVFMQGISDSGYIIPWMGLFKIIAGVLLAIPKTSPLGVIAAFPYAVNIILYVFFISFEDYLAVGIFDFIVSVYLMYAYSEYFKPMVNYK